MLLKYKILPSLIILLIFSRCGREDIILPIDNGLPPATPTGFVIDGAFDGQIGISWQPNDEADISGYNIYRSIGETNYFQLVHFSPNTYFDDSGLEYDSTYYYKISAVDKTKLESGLSSAVSATPRNHYAPLHPYKVNINGRNQDNAVSIFLSWSPSVDTDIAYYEIHRDTIQFDAADNSNLIDNADETFYSDVNNLILFKKYYYRIAAVDKGGLKSQPTEIVYDYILDKPTLISPPNGSEVIDLTGFKIMTVNLPADYKMTIQNSPAGSVVKDINFTSAESDKVISINTNSLQLEPYKTYFWRVFTYTNNNSEPNSYSELFSFYYNPN